MSKTQEKDVIVRIADVDKSFDGERVVKKLNLDVERGRVPDHAGALRLRKDDDAADDCRL